MSLYTSSWGRPIQGVSQQPPKTRMEGQAQSQENMVASAVRGLFKRNGTEYRGHWGTDKIPEGSLIHFYEGSGEEQYTMVVHPTTGKVVIMKDSSIVQEIVGDSYLQTGNPTKDLVLKTIADTTFVINKTIKPTVSSAKSPKRDSRVIINMQFADYGRKYGIYVNGNRVAVFETPTGKESEHIKEVDTSYVAAKLYASFQSFLTVANGGNLGCDQLMERVNKGTQENPRWEDVDTAESLACKAQQAEWQATISALGRVPIDIVRDRNTLIVSGFDMENVTIRTEDGANGQDLIAIDGRVRDTGQLPRVAPAGYVVQVSGTGANAKPYYLKADDSRGDTIKWVETIAPDTSIGLDANTMPRIIGQDAGGVFSIGKANWASREVGDLETNPDPSFASYNGNEGIPITNLGVFQNRLYLLSGEAVVFSKSAEFFQLYKQTAQQDLPDDPVDIYADTERINNLHGGAVLDGDLVFFSKNGQFLQTGESAITPESATLKHVSTFESLRDVQPVASGDVIFFAYAHGSFTGIREFFTDSIVATKKAVPVTDHVNQYIQGKATQVISSGSQNFLFVLAEPTNTLYVYQWIWQGGDRVQSAWGKWVWPVGEEILAAFLEGDYLILFIRKDGFVMRTDLDLSDHARFGLPFILKMDNKTEITFERTPSGGFKAELPAWHSEGDDLVIVQGEGCYDEGSEIDFQISDGLIKTSDDMTEGSSCPAVIGCSFEAIYEPTMPYLRDGSDRVIDTDRLILNDVNVNYDKLGKIDVIVTNDYGATREYSFNGRVLGKVNNLIGLKDNTVGSFKFPVRQQTDRVTFRLISKDPYEFQLRDMEWRGRFNQRGRRV